MALTNKLSAIGDAIRAKTGKSEKLTLDAMVTEIGSITTGGGGGDLPEEAFILTGDCSSMFSNNKWKWFINMYGNRITTNNISDASKMFYEANELTSIPFQFDMTTGARIDGMFGYCSKLEHIEGNIDLGTPSTYQDAASVFAGCGKLETVPYIYGLYAGKISYFFAQCYRLREIPEDYFDTWNFSRLNTNNYASVSSMFNSCYSLRRIPLDGLRTKLAPIATGPTYSLYNNMCTACIALDELVGIPVISTATYTTNAFNDTAKNCSRLKRLTFATNEDGTPIVVKWKGQTLDLSTGVGYTSALLFAEYLLDHNPTITADKEVTNLSTYNALKNDDDWYTQNLKYSRYNHDSAVETIYSLPDTSAYLAANGGTNTIKFRKEAGKSTDGGAIQDITSEEEVGVVVAAATAKGWTVAWVT